MVGLRSNKNNLHRTSEKNLRREIPELQVQCILNTERVWSPKNEEKKKTTRRV